MLENEITFYDAFDKGLEENIEKTLIEVESPLEDTMAIFDYSILRKYYESFLIRFSDVVSHDKKQRAIENLIYRYHSVDAYRGNKLLIGQKICGRVIIIQQFAKFYLFTSDEDFNYFAEHFKHKARVNEIIPIFRCRFPVFDIDSRLTKYGETIKHEEIIEYFGNLCGGAEIISFNTNKGYHVLCKKTCNV